MATRYPDTQIVDRSRRNRWRVLIYEVDGVTPYVLDAAEVVQCKFWDGVDGSTAYLTVNNSAATANGSIIVVDDVDPATVTITVEAADAALIPRDKQRLEIVCILNSKSTVVARCEVIAEASPA